MTADQVTNYMKGNEIHVQMSRFNYFTYLFSSAVSYHPDLGSAFTNWSCCEENLFSPIRGITQILVVTHHQYGISGLLPQISFHGEISVGFFLRLQVCLLHLLPSLEWDGLHSIVFFPFLHFFLSGRRLKK